VVPADKLKKLMQKQRETYESLKTYFAYSYAVQLAAEERDAGHLELGRRTPYALLLTEFRRMEGFSRLLGESGNQLSQPTLGNGQWKQLLAAFHAFDLLNRMMLSADEDVQAVLSETTALHVVLLRQTALGLRLNHPAFSETYRNYRSVAHILIGLFSAWRGSQDPDAWAIKESEREPEPGIEELKDLLSPTVVAAIDISLNAESAFQSRQILRKGGSLISEAYQVRLPKGLKVTKAKSACVALHSEELQVLRALKGLRDARRRGAKLPKWFSATPIQMLTSSTSKDALCNLIKCAREIGIQL